MNLTFAFDYHTIPVVIKEVEHSLDILQTNSIIALGNEMVRQAQNTNKFQHSEKFNQGIHFHLLNNKEGEVSSHSETANGVEYSNFLEYGNDPGGGVIYPVQAKTLHFFANGKEIFAKSVKAISPEKLGFFTDAQTATETQVDNIVDQQFQKLFGL
jgi:hypothetical protein